MKSLMDLNANECKFAMTESDTVDQSWAHARLGASGPGVLGKSHQWVGGGAHPHQFCAEAVQPGSVYCPAHHARCYRGPGKDPVSLEAMMYATDHSQIRAATGYADHTEPMDVELAREKPKGEPAEYAAARHHHVANKARPAR
jgi:hypothetical protein